MVVLPPVNEPAEWNTNYILFWNSLALDLNRLVTSVAGPGNSPPSASRYLAILHLAINDTYFSINPDKSGVATTYLSATSTPPRPALIGADNAELAVAGAANTVLRQLYTTPDPSIATASTNEIADLIQSYLDKVKVLDTLSRSWRFGVAVGNAILSALDQGLAPFNQGKSFRIFLSVFFLIGNLSNALKANTESCQGSTSLMMTQQILCTLSQST